MRRLAILAVPFVVVVLIGTGATSAAAASADPFARSCPSTTLEVGATGKLNRNPAARKAIVPAGATSLRLCRYYGFGAGRQTPKTQARAGNLQDQAVVHSRAVLEGLTFEFKELAAAPKGPISCPFDEGAELYAVFFYPHAKPVILHVSLSGCRFVAGAAPRARWLNQSLEHKLLRLVEGRHVKVPGHDKVSEKSVAEYHPPHLKIARARHETKAALAEDCAGLCTSFKVTGCDRKTAAVVVCGVQATLESGRVCHSHFRLRLFEEGALATEEGSDESLEAPCGLVLFPPELREHLEEVEELERK